MLTFRQSICNLSHYIVNNYKYLLGDKCTAEFHESAWGHYLHLSIRVNTSVILHEHIIVVNRYEKDVLEEFIKIFNVPDFHIRFNCELTINYQTLDCLFKYIKDDPRVNHDMYLTLGDNSPDEELLEDITNRDNILGIICDNDFINDKYIKLLFERMNRLKYIWCGITEYYRSYTNNKIENHEYDGLLRIIELHCRNELLEGDYKNKYYFSCTNNIHKNPYSEH